MPARSNRIAAECRNTCMVTDFCASDGQTPVAFRTYLASLCSRASRLSALPELCGEQRGFWLTGALGQPGAQDGDRARGERRDPLLSSFSVATHMCAGSEMDIGAAKADQFRCPKAGLGSEAEQCVVAPPGPLRPIGRGKQRVDFRLGQEGHEPSVEALWVEWQERAR